MWTKSQKISAAVLGLAVTAFAVDRWVLGGPEGAHAASSEYAVTKSSSSTSHKPTGSKPAVAATTDTANPSPIPTASAPAVNVANRLAAIGQQRRLTGAASF